MLYDKRWEQKTKADPFTLESLIAWLEKQPPETAYIFECNGHCLLAQYFTAMGFKKVIMLLDQFFHGERQKEEQLPAYFNDIAVARFSLFQNRDHTFGGALERARACLRT